MNRGIAVLAALVLGLVAGRATSASAPTEAEALKHAADRGRLIYAYDQAAWVSTDELLRRAPDPHAVGVAGFVVEPAADGVLRAIYYRLDGDAPRAVFTADIKGRKVVSSRLLGAGDDARLSALAARMVQARRVAAADAAKRGLKPCAPAPFNPVALPPETPEAATPVYLLTPQVKDGEYPVGGHYEVDVAADGSIAATRPFTRSCLTLSTANVPDGGRSVAVAVTHLLDPTPTEIHVYLALWMGEPVIVATGQKTVWRVEGDRISREEDPPAH